jgi:RNA polymerase sigma factor (sigma-70 family)
MAPQPVSDEVQTSALARVSEDTLTRRILPACNPDRQDRARAWAEWQERYGTHVLARFVRAHNNTREADDDILQDALITAYLGVECGRYQPRDGAPFAAYVVGIARNKIREARRRDRRLTGLDEETQERDARLIEPPQYQPERAVERRETQRDRSEQLRSGLARLSSARRQVIERYLAGASTVEIAGQMQISEELVRQHKCRGLRALQRDLLGEGHGRTVDGWTSI